MLLLLLLVATDIDFISTTSYMQYQYDEEGVTQKLVSKINDVEFEPVVNLKDRHILHTEKNINCEEFTTYALNCTVESAMIYNSSKKSPPMPVKMTSWCQALRHLTNCAIDWNSECKDVTESHFNEESIKGHMHVVNNICNDEWFLTHYDMLPSCIDKVDSSWETCYIIFKSIVDFHKNATPEWTHYATHFQLCCARMSFRRCTLDALFIAPNSRCQYEHAIVLQKFSVIVSEGDVFQECDHNVMYKSCPGGDPRPPSNVLAKLMNAEDNIKLGNAAPLTSLFVLVWFICLLHLFL